MAEYKTLLDNYTRRSKVFSEIVRIFRTKISLNKVISQTWVVYHVTNELNDDDFDRDLSELVVEIKYLIVEIKILIENIKSVVISPKLW